MKHPKFFMGFSDATTFLFYLNQLGLVTFYGPAVMAGFAQLKHLPTEFKEHLQTLLIYSSYRMNIVYRDHSKFLCTIFDYAPQS